VLENERSGGLASPQEEHRRISHKTQLKLLEVQARKFKCTSSVKNATWVMGEALVFSLKTSYQLKTGGLCTVPYPGVDQKSKSKHGGTPQGTQGR